MLAGVSGRIWATFLPSEAAPADGTAPRGVSILARDLQSVVFYDSKGTFVGVRRPDSGKPIEVNAKQALPDFCVALKLLCQHNRLAAEQEHFTAVVVCYTG